MDDAELRKVVLAVVEEILEFGPNEIYEDADLVDDLGGDSLQILELVRALERRFKIRYSPIEAVEFVTVADILRATRRHVLGSAERV